MSVNWSASSREDMPGRFPGNLTSVRLLFLALLALSAAAIPQLIERGKFSGRTLGSYSTLWVVLLGIVFTLALLQLIFTALVFSAAQPGLARWAGRAQQTLTRHGWLSGLGMAAAWLAYVLLVLYRYQKHFADFLPQVWLFWLAVGIGAFFLSALWKKTPFLLTVLYIAIFYGAAVKALGYAPDISSYPFSLEWSEGSRYYYASLPYSRWLYGFQIPLSFLHPSRYLLQSLAFWSPSAGLWFHRFWQVVLWLGLSGLAGLALARQIKTGGVVRTLAVAAWAALFLLEGPVYYHLLVCVILVLVGYDARRFWKTLIFVVLASIWAGISRVNWIPVPAMIAASLYLLDRPYSMESLLVAGRSWLARLSRYLWRPLTWGVAGGAAGLLAQVSYALVSGHEDKTSFLSSFTSDLLWYRLIPSPTFRFGVLPAILLVSGPLLVLMIVNWLRNRADWHWLRVWGIAVMLAVLFAGGLVVSTKIGGGSNIHNLDAFSTLLLVVGAAIGAGRFRPETGGPAQVWRPWLLTLTLVVLPVVWCLNIGDPFVRQPFKQGNYDLNKLTSMVQDYAKHGEVLFITQRQLEVFNLIPGVRMVPDYELLTLTEMSISHNQAYFDRFDQDLRNHRFALIVANKQQTVIKNPTRDAFAEENNAWVEKVSLPLLQYYKQKLFFDTQGIQLLVPR